MFGKKVKKTVALLCLVSLFGTGGMTVYAKNHFYEFSFKDDVNTKDTDYYQKSDKDSHWYISLSYYDRTGVLKNTLSSSNIFGCKIHRETNDIVDRYHTFSNYVQNYAMDYRNEVFTGDHMKLTGKKDDSSTSTAKLKVSGQFAP